MEEREESRSVFLRAAGVVGSMPAFAKELLAGGVAGGFAKTAVAPLDRVKILLQTRKKEFENVGVIGTFGKVAKNEGVAGFYRGNGASVARIVPYAALHYMVYEEYRGLLLQLCPRIGTGPFLDLIAGSFAGGTAVISTYPLDLIRTKLAFQVVESTDKLKVGVPQSSKGLVYKGIIDCFSRTYREAGIRGLYRGVAPTLYGIFPYSGLKFYAYEEMKSRVAEERRRDITVKLACGSVAGLLGQTFTYPFEVVRRQMQVQTVVGSDGRDVRGTVETFSRIIHRQGWRQLFSGLTINYFKVVPSAAIGFTVYDVMKSVLGLPPREIAAVETITTKS